jgi:hypothetical protein
MKVDVIDDDKNVIDNRMQILIDCLCSGMSQIL